MLKICQIDGGGAKGIIPFAVIRNIENELGKPFHEIFDLVVGSSIGGIINAILTIHDGSAESMMPKFKDSLKAIFSKRMRIPIFQPKYSRDVAAKELGNYLSGTKLSDAKTKMMFTSVNMVDGRTHYFKSWEDEDGSLDTVNAINRTYAAPLFFGSLVDEKNKAVWLDGGTSNNNCPLVETYIETLRQGWVDDTEVHIMSIGCGQSSYKVPFNEAKKYKNIRQVSYFMDPTDGGLARLVAGDTQVEWLKQLDEVTPCFSFQRIQKIDMDPKLDGMDKINCLDEYEKIGDEISKQINYEYLR
jgi:hypothetical protein